MKTRLFAMGAAFCMAAVLAACGGGGGGTPPPPPPAPTPTPTPQPTANPYGCVGSSPFAVGRRPMTAYPTHPTGAGDSFAYTGSEQVSYTQNAPCAQPSSAATASVTATVTNYATSAPAGATTDQRSIESDAFPTKTVTTTTDLAVANTASAYQLFQTKSADTSGNVITMTYTNPQQLDLLTGAPPQSWGGNGTNNPAGTLTETLADGAHITRTIASDGSYVDTETYTDGSTATITVDGQATSLASPTGAGTYAFSGAQVTYTFSPPAGGTITLNAQTPAKTVTRTYPSWFTLPASYITDNFTTSASSSVDARCASGIPAVNKQISETYTVLDPIVGYTETRTTTSYVADGYGAVCVTIDDLLSSYYDYSGDTTVGLYYSRNAQPNSTNHIVEVLNMTAPAAPYQQARTRSSIMPVSAQQVASRITAIAHIREVQRAQTVDHLHELMTVSAGGQLY